MKNTIEIDGKHYYSQEYVDVLLSNMTSGVGVLLPNEEEVQFKDWHMKLLNSHMTKDTSSLGTCSFRDLIRDKKVLTMMRVVWYNLFVRKVEPEDE